MKITVIGGDERQVRLARLLREDGHDVATCALGDTGLSGRIEDGADVFVLPLPAVDAAGNINTPLEYGTLSAGKVAGLIPAGALVLAGKLPPDAARLFPGAIDYFKREELTLRNADITAEGAVQLIMEESPKAVRDMDILIVGAGRIGLLLARKLRALGAKVTVTARREEDFARISLADCTPAATAEIAALTRGRDAVVNTVPARIISREALENMPKPAVLIDLASMPGGFGMGEASELGLRALRAASLPGRCAPESAAAAIRDTIYNILRERREKDE